jgi:hypothetical protein
LKFFGLFCCVCIHCFNWSLVSTFTKGTQILSPVIPMMWLRNWSPSLGYRCYKAEAIRGHSLYFVPTQEHFWNPCCTKLVTAQPNCDNLVENSAWKLWKFWNYEASPFTNFLVNNLNKIFNHYRWPTILLFIVNICSHAHLWIFYSNVLQFLQALHFGHKSCMIHDGFQQHSRFKHEEIGLDISMIINHRTHHNLLCKDKNKL